MHPPQTLVPKIHNIHMHTKKSLLEYFPRGRRQPMPLRCLRPKRTHWSRPARTLWSFARKPRRIPGVRVYASLAPACPISSSRVLNMYVHIFKMLGLGNQKLVLTTKPSKHSGMRQANDEKPVTNCLQMDQTSSYYLDQSGPLCSTGSCFTFQQMPAAGPLPDRPPAPRAPSELACKHLCWSFRSSGSKSNAFTPNDFKRRLACLELYRSTKSTRSEHLWTCMIWNCMRRVIEYPPCSSRGVVGRLILE